MVGLTFEGELYS